MRRKTKLDKLLDAARARLYETAGGAYIGGQAGVATLCTRQRIEFFRCPEFRSWVAAVRSSGTELFWQKDLDKTQASGDIFTKFFMWRAVNHKFSPGQLGVMEAYLTNHASEVVRSGIKGSGEASHSDLLPETILRFWKEHESGREGLSLLDFWTDIYWPTQIGLTREEKLSQVAQFVPHYASSIFHGVAEENKVLEEAGIHVVVVSNGDQELAVGVAPLLGVKEENVVGSHLLYDENGLARGMNHSYDFLGGKEWEERPQPGKVLSFHYWLHINRNRFGWRQMHDDLFEIAGRDGDSASSDGGMMILHKRSLIGNFMVNTPGEPARLQKFRRCAAKYGFTAGQFFTLEQEAAAA